MKKVSILLLKPILILVLLGMISVIFIAYKWETSIDKVLSEEQQQWLNISISKSEDLPPNFYKTIEKYYPNYFKISVWDSVLSQLTNDISKDCQCRDIYLPNIPGRKLENKHWIPFNQQWLVIALELEEKYSQRKCYSYNLSITHFGYNNKGVRQAAKFYYQKELEQLTEREIIALNIIRQAPTYYNPLDKPEVLEKAIDKIVDSNNPF